VQGSYVWDAAGKRYLILLRASPSMPSATRTLIG